MKVTTKGIIILPGLYGDFYYHLLGKLTYAEVQNEFFEYSETDVEFFHVASEKGKKSVIGVKGAYVLNFASAGKEIEVLDEEVLTTLPIFIKN